MMQRIVFVTRSLGVGGTEKHLADLIERLDRATCEVVVLTMGLDPYTARLGAKKGPRVRVAAGPRPERFAASWRVFRSLRPRVVVFVNGDLGQFHWQMYLAARFSGAGRVVAIEHSIAKVPERQKTRGGAASLGRWLRRRVTTRLPGLICDTTICVSDAVRERLVREYGYPAAKTITRRNGVDLKLFARGAAVWEVPHGFLAGNGAGPVAVCVSLLVPSKRLDVLIHAMKKVVTHYPESRCVIVGGGVSEGKLRSLVDELGLEKNVLFAGQKDDVRPYLAVGDVFVSASEREGFGLALLEAMAFGLPCVAAEAGGNREVVRDGINALVVPAGSADALADAIARMFGDPEARVRMGKSGRRIAEEEFDIEKSMARVKSAILGGE